MRSIESITRRQFIITSTAADGRTSAEGAYPTRGFYGDYDVTVTHVGKTTTVRLKMTHGAAVQTIIVPL